MIIYNGKSRIIKRIVDVVNDLDGAGTALRLYDDATTAISSLLDIPTNCYGRINIRGDLVPFGGTSSSYQTVIFQQMSSEQGSPAWRSLTVQSINAGTVYSNTYDGSSWTGWKQLTP